MSRDVKFMVEQVHRRLIGAKITVALTSEDDFSFGFRIVKDNAVFDVWVDCDAEGNGPGWLTIEPAGTT